MGQEMSDEVRALLDSLIKGIESWAEDEDGVHPDCWQAYLAACSATGRIIWIEKEVAKK